MLHHCLIRVRYYAMLLKLLISADHQDEKSTSTKALGEFLILIPNPTPFHIFSCILYS